MKGGKVNRDVSIKNWEDHRDMAYGSARVATVKISKALQVRGVRAGHDEVRLAPMIRMALCFAVRRGLATAVYRWWRRFPALDPRPPPPPHPPQPRPPPLPPSFSPPPSPPSSPTPMDPPADASHVMLIEPTPIITDAQPQPPQHSSLDPREHQGLISRLYVAERHSTLLESELKSLNLENQRLKSRLEALEVDAIRLNLETDRLSTKIDEATYIQWHSTDYINTQLAQRDDALHRYRIREDGIFCNCCALLRLPDHFFPEGNREELGDLEGKEGSVSRIAGGDGEAPEPRKGTLGSAAVKEAGSTRGRSDWGVQKGEESPRGHHCRGCSLSVWVASGIETVQVINEGRGIMRVVGIIVTSCPKGHGGGAKPAIFKV